MERIVNFYPAWDKRNLDSQKDYGIHCVEIYFVLKGIEGAVSFTILSGWFLSNTTDKLLRSTEHKSESHFGVGDFFMCHFQGRGVDVSYHSLRPLKEWHKSEEPSTKKCEWLEGKPCWCDGSSLNAKRIFNILVERGSNAVWQELENYYNETFKAKGELKC